MAQKIAMTCGLLLLACVSACDQSALIEAPSSSAPPPIATTEDTHEFSPSTDVLADRFPQCFLHVIESSVGNIGLGGNSSSGCLYILGTVGKTSDGAPVRYINAEEERTLSSGQIGEVPKVTFNIAIWMFEDRPNAIAVHTPMLVSLDEPAGDYAFLKSGTLVVKIADEHSFRFPIRASLGGNTSAMEARGVLPRYGDVDVCIDADPFCAEFLDHLLVDSLIEIDVFDSDGKSIVSGRVDTSRLREAAATHGLELLDK